MTAVDTAARITALRAMRQLARQHGDSDKVVELTNEIGQLTQQARRLQQDARASQQQQEAMP